MLRKLIAPIALTLAVLLPVRAFAAEVMMTCLSHQNTHQQSIQTENALPTHEMPCHEMQASSDETVAQSMGNDCMARCTACAMSCAAPLMTPQALAFSFLAPDTSSTLPAFTSSFQSAQLTRADKPPVV